MKKLIALLVLLALISCTNSKNNKSIKLLAKVEKSDTQLVLTNNDRFPWEDIKVVINNDYNYHVERIAAGETVKIGFLNFSNSKYEKLNPFLMKIAEIQIFCKAKDGKEGFVSASFQ